MTHQPANGSDPPAHQALGDEQVQERLTAISTEWSLVFKAHGDSELAQPAGARLIHRYLAAIYRYLLAMVRNPELAEELCQQVALKFLEGAFHRADPDRGRFRDYVKTVLINLVRQHYKSRTQQLSTLPDQLADLEPAAAEDEEIEFVRQWREEVLNQTWDALRRERPVYHDLLQLRIIHPEMTSRQLADRYVAQHSRSMTPANVRKTLERAHVKFADLLVAEVAMSLDQPDAVRLRRELEDLDLLKYCRSAFERWAAPS